MKLPPFGSDAFIDIALRLERGEMLTAAETAGFVAAVGARVLYAERRDPDGALRAAPAHPGYLHRTVARRDVFVPFNLAFTLPREDLLIEVVHAAEAVRLGYGHPICISGSTTFMGRLRRSADLDFCEYYPSAPGTLAPAIADRARTVSSPYFVRIKCDGTEIVLPCDGLRARLDEMLGDGTAEDTPTVKFDFVGVSERLGIMPVSSVVIPVRSDGFDAGSARASFAYQEAVVGMTSPPRSLIRTEEFARYLLWLVDACKSWLGAEHAGEVKAPLKSLKRALSAFLLLGYDIPRDEARAIAEALSEDGDAFAPVDEILSSLNDGTLARIADDLRFADLRALAPLDCARVPADIVRSIHESEPLDPETVALALEGARALAEGLVDHIEAEFERVGAGLT